MAAARLTGAKSIRRGGTRADQRGFVSDRAMAIDAVDLHRGPGLAVDFAVAVIVLREMAVGALHAFFQMDVGEMDDLWRWRFLTYFLELREPFTKDAWSRVSRFSNYRMLTGRPWQRVRVADGRIATPDPAVQEQPQR